MHDQQQDPRREPKKSLATMDRRTAIKASLTSAAAAGATFQPQVLGFVQPRKNLSGDGNGIFSFRPAGATVCETVQITGRGFGLNTANVLCSTRNPAVHFQTGQVLDQRILTQPRFGTITVPGPLNVTLGQGGFATPTPNEFPDTLFPYGRFWAWRANGGPAYVSQDPFVFLPPTTMSAGELIFEGRRETAQIRTLITLPLNDDCCFVAPYNTFVAFSLNMQNHTADQQLAAQGQFWAQAEFGPRALAKAIGSVIVSTVLSLTGIELTFSTLSLAADRAYLDINRPGFTYDTAHLALRLNTNGRVEDCRPPDSQNFDSVSMNSHSLASLGINSLSVDSGSVASVSMSVPSEDPCTPSIQAQCDSMSIGIDYPPFLFQ
ncbi:hypothetical protein [Acanthopleuribacter pedis]|uniref:Uncharacterized protein n=1 Tax=Acanthopleuribacter pedis TaxID=442870 RepID=A0A8J7Q581_9BACT|nr:hypothetical protein [Acanthopleuribacter pedis]MBO1318136.1 hypothetical protein [Acanthopleuribacter pedis]